MRDMQPHPLRLERIDPSRNMKRWYALRLEPSLFPGDWVVARSWGRIGHAGRLRLDLYGDVLQASTALDRLARAKRRRGYREVA